MVKQSRRHSNHKSQHLTLPELDQSKSSVLNTLGSLQSRRSYHHAIEEFIAWYCSEPRLALNRIVVLRYRMNLEGIPLAPANINLWDWITGEPFWANSHLITGQISRPLWS